MQQIHTCIMKKTKSAMRSIRCKIAILNKFKSKFPPELLTEIISKNQQSIKKELQDEGAVLGDKFQELLKNIKSRSFDLMTLLQKTQEDLDNYYEPSQNKVQEIGNIVVPEESRPMKIIKTKKIKKQIKNKNDQVKVENQIYEESEQNFMVK